MLGVGVATAMIAVSDNSATNILIDRVGMENVNALLASLGLRVYLHFFNTYSITYGSLGAVIILLTWFYITGLMLLLGAEINSEIEAAAAEKRLAGRNAPPPSADTPAQAPPPQAAA